MKVAIDSLFDENSLFFIICGDNSRIKYAANVAEKILCKCGKNVLNLCSNAEIKGEKTYNAVIMRGNEKSVCSGKDENTFLICLPDYKVECLEKNCYNKAVVPYCADKKPQRAFTYSDKYDDADMAAKNVRESCGKIIFELLTLDFIGRVKTDSTLPVSVLELLSVLGGLVCAGIDEKTVTEGACSI